jgi:hypothetical protein
VTTVEDLVARLQKSSGIARGDLKPAKVLYQGKVLERKDLLRQAGVLDGANLIVVTDNYQLKGKEVLALILEMLKEDSWENRFQATWRSSGASLVQQIQEAWKEQIQYLQPSDVSNALRHSLDLSYHTLRRTWEHPMFRQSLQDPNRIEAYRQVVASHLSKKILKEIPGAKAMVNNPEAWRKQVFKATSGFLRLGDIVLDGLLDIVLDIVKGVGKRNEMNMNPHSHSSEQQQYTPTMEDPSLANNLLFELSESEDED